MQVPLENTPSHRSIKERRSRHGKVSGVKKRHHEFQVPTLSAHTSSQPEIPFLNTNRLIWQEQMPASHQTRQVEFSASAKSRLLTLTMWHEGYWVVVPPQTIYRQGEARGESTHSMMSMDSTEVCPTSPHQRVSSTRSKEHRHGLRSPMAHTSGEALMSTSVHHNTIDQYIRDATTVGIDSGQSDGLHPRRGFRNTEVTGTRCGVPTCARRYFDMR